MRWWGLVLLAATPLQWFVVARGPGGAIRIHQVVMLLFALLVLTQVRRGLVLPLIRASWPFVVCTAYLVSISVVTQVLNGGRPLAAIEDATYLVVYLAFGTYIYLYGSGRLSGGVEVLRWSALAASLVFLIAMVLSMARNGVSPATVVQQAVAAGDPEIIQKQIFKSSFGGYGYDPETVLGNMRHEIFGAVLVSMYVSSWAVKLKPLAARWALALWRLAMVLCVVLLALSMSRSILIAAAAWPLISFIQYVRTFALTYGQMAMVAGSVVGVLGLIVSGVGQVLWVRFTVDTSSYSAREGLYANAFAEISHNPVFGGYSTVGQSSHNLVLDAWLRSGVLAAVAAAMVLLVLIVTWGKVLVGLTRDPIWMLPAAAAFALPIDRALTAGGGAIPPVEWLALGLAFGALTVRKQGNLEHGNQKDDLSGDPLGEDAFGGRKSESGVHRTPRHERPRPGVEGQS